MVEDPLAPGGAVPRRWRVLRLVFQVSVRSSAYNQFTLPAIGRHEVTLCCLRPSELVVDPVVRVFEGDGTIKGFLRTLRRAFDDGEYDVVHAHSPHVGFLLLIAAIFMQRARKLVRSSVYTLGTAYPNLKMRNRLMVLCVLAGFTRVVCCSRTGFESCPPVARWLAGKRLGYIANGVNLERVDDALTGTGGRSGEDAPEGREPFTVAVIGRLEAIKQPGLVIEAFAEAGLASGELVFIGAGPLRDSLVERARSRNLLPHVRFTGLVAREAVYVTLLGVDVVVSASRVEGLPVAVLEAMACGRPVILSDIPPHREIACGTTGIPLIDCDDAAGFARALTQLAAMPRAERTAIGVCHRQHVERHFDLTETLRQYEEEYAAVCGV